MIDFVDLFRSGNKFAVDFIVHVKDMADCLLSYSKHLNKPSTPRQNTSTCMGENIRVFNVSKSEFGIQNNYTKIQKDLDQLEYNESLILNFGKHFPAKKEKDEHSSDLLGKNDL